MLELLIPRTGVFIPAYQEPGLIDTIRSVGNQADLIVVVNNDADDEGLAASPGVRELEAEWPHLHVITEPEKGTGTACDAGVRALLEREVEVVLRTDADTVVGEGWVGAATRHLAENPGRQLVYGTTLPREDDGHFLEADRELWDRFWPETRELAVQATGDLLYSHNVAGANVAFRSTVYEQVQFPHVRIEDVDDDRRFARGVWNLEADTPPEQRVGLGYEPSMVVYTSLRRIRALQKASATPNDPEAGYNGLQAYYFVPEADRAAKRAAMFLDARVDVR